MLGTVATDVLGRFLGMDEHGLARLRALGDAVGGGHLRIYSTDEDVQAGLDQLGVSGALAPRAGDFLGVTVNNGSGSKIDYYATRHVGYQVKLGGDGEAIGVVTLAIDNAAPTHGQPRYVIGPFLKDAAAGDQIPLTNVWCGSSCSLISATRDGEPIAMAAGTENGAVWFQDYRTIPAGDTGELTLTTRTQNAWEGNSSGGSYTLTFSPQTTVRPTDLEVTIHAPSGNDIVWTNQPMAVDGGTAVWQGTPESTLKLSVRFRASLPLRLLRDATRPIVGVDQPARRAARRRATSSAVTPSATNTSTISAPIRHLTRTGERRSTARSLDRRSGGRRDGVGGGLSQCAPRGNHDGCHGKHHHARETLEHLH